MKELVKPGALSGLKVLDLSRVLAGPWVSHMEGVSGSSIPLVANPINLSASPVSYRHAQPELGQHSSEVLKDWLGMSVEDVSTLSSQNII